MATKKKHGKPTNAVITLPDPDNLDVTRHAHIGGRIEWRCETPKYPIFEIVFGSTNPFNKETDFVLTGTIDAPIVRVAEITGDHEYHIRHLPPKGASKGTPAIQSGPFNAQVTKCTHCP